MTTDTQPSFEAVIKQLHDELANERSFFGHETESLARRLDFEERGYIRVVRVVNSSLHWYWPVLGALRQCFSERSNPVYDFFHVKRIFAWAVRIWAREKRCADLEIVCAAALFCEMADTTEMRSRFSRTNVSNVADARVMLSAAGFPTQKLDAVVTIVQEFFSGSVSKTDEERIVRDAGTLEQLGATCIARLFIETGVDSRPIVNYGDDTGYPKSPQPVAAIIANLRVVSFQTSAAADLNHLYGLSKAMDAYLEQLHREQRFARI